MLRKLLSVVIATLLLTTSLSAQSYRMFTTENGLPSTSITYIYQDSFGFVWIATENGLVRYDGARFVTYSHRENDPSSLAHDFVTSLTEDKKGNLFVSTYMGVQVYNYDTNTFSANVCWDDGSPFGDNANQVFCSSEGNMYSVGYSINRLSFDGHTLTAHKLPMPSGVKNFIKMQEDINGCLWVNVSNTLYCIEGNQIKQQYDLSTIDANLRISDFVISPDGIFYVLFSNRGLMEFDPDKLTLSPVSVNCTSRNIFHISTRNERLYLSGDCGFVAIIDRKKSAVDYSVSEVVRSIYSDSNINLFVPDREGNLWLSISQKGVLMIQPNQFPFRNIGHSDFYSDDIGDNGVTSMYIDGEGSMWLGTDGDGLFVLDGDGSVKSHFRQPSKVRSFFQDNYGKMWIGDDIKGVACYDYKTHTIRPDAMMSDIGTVMHVHDIQSDNMGRLWVATMGDGLYCYDQSTGKATSINAVNKMIHKWLTALHVASDGTLWIGSYDGLEHVNIHNKDYPNQRYLKRTIVYDIKTDNDETLWLATSAGLFQMSQKGDTLSRFTTLDRLPSQSLAALQIDASGKIWISSNMGLSKLDPVSRQIVNFYSDDGLQGNEFCKHASFADSLGRLWFGGYKGVTYFLPNDVRAGTKPWHVRLVAMTLDGDEVSTSTVSDNRPVTDKPIFLSNEVNLAYEDNTFSLFFGTEELNCPEKMQFEYSLNGQPWQQLPVGVHSVSFSNLASGKYTFAVKVANSQRGTTQRTLTIVIRPQWFHTWWAYTLLLTIVLLFLGLIVLTILAHYRNKHERLLAEQQDAMHDAQTRSFIDLTHEIRTPLMLILDPVRHLLSVDNDPSHQASYITIQRNANHILRLMEQMIALRKADKGVLNLHFSECNLIEVLGNVYADFMEQARLKQIDFTYQHDGLEQLPVWVDSNYFDKIVINLVSNALKYTPMGGEVRLKVSIPDSQWVKIDVTDNGPGIPESEREHIFERFYRSHSVLDGGAKGSGIGLNLTRTLVNMHHGRIELISRTSEPSGSTFSVVLPLGCAHLTDEEKCQESKSSNNRLPLSVDSFVAEANATSKTKYRILVADDEPEMLTYLKKELSADFHVQGCANGEEAFSLLLREKFHLLISDVMMPKLDGIALCAKIRQNIHLNHIPVILLTANTEEHGLIEGLEHGADTYLTKPVSIEILKKGIYNLIHNRELLYNNFAGRQLDEDKLEKLHEKTPDEQLMERVMRVLNCELSNPDLTVEMVADKVGLSRVHLNRKLKELTNQTARDFIRNVRLRQAATLLSQGNIPVSRVATMVGFPNPAYFATSFQALYGVSPKNYQPQKQES